MSPATSESTGSFDFTRADDSTSQWVVIAPNASMLPSCLMPVSPGTLRRSMMCLGWASRSFIIGIRLWPPARSLASSLCLPRRASASFTLVGAWYSNAAGYIVRSPGLPGALRALNGVPHPLGRQRHRLDVIHTEPGERVHDRIHHCRRRRDRSGLARALDAHGIDRGGRDRPVRLVHREHVGLGHRVVHHAARHQLPGLAVVYRALAQGLTDTLGNAAVHHAVDDHRVDDVADVVHRQIAEDLHVPGLALHLDDAGVGAEREAEVRRIVERRLLEPGLEPLGIVVRHVRGQRDGAERYRLARRALDAELAPRVLDVAR